MSSSAASDLTLISRSCLAPACGRCASAIELEPGQITRVVQGTGAEMVVNALIPIPVDSGGHTHS